MTENLPSGTGVEHNPPKHRRDKIWIARFLRKGHSDYFRTFTSFSGLTGSLNVDPKFQHPCWSEPFELYEVNFHDKTLTDVTQKVMDIVAKMPKTPLGEHDEQNPTPQF